MPHRECAGGHEGEDLTEVAIAAFATALGFRMYQRADMLHKVLGAGLVVYGLLGGFLWLTVGVWPG